MHKAHGNWSLWNLLKKIEPVAEANDMEALLLGRLVKIYPKGVRSKALLEISYEYDYSDSFDRPSFRLYKHRTPKLTHKYKGSVISDEWVVGFIKANKKGVSQAQEIDKKNARVKTENPHAPKLREQPLTDEEIKTKKSERHTKNCSCNGHNLTCSWCDGKAFYIVDGYGNRV